MRLLTTRTRLLGAIAGGAVLLGALWILQQSDLTATTDLPATTDDPERPARLPLDPPRTPPSPSAEESAGPRSMLAEAQQAVLDAEKTYEAAEAEVSAAQSEMAGVERQVEALERFIQDLKDRGEDPADHAYEGMELLNPTLEAYQRAAVRGKLADNGLQEATTRLEEAEANLRAVRRRLEDEPTP